jgi:hypothetical protein
VAVAARKPRELEYRLDSSGVHIANKTFPYNHFKSFSLVQQGAVPSILFSPLKRFDFMITAIYDQVDEKKIHDILSVYLPVEENNLDWIDRLMWKIKY